MERINVYTTKWASSFLFISRDNCCRVLLQQFCERFSRISSNAVQHVHLPLAPPRARVAYIISLYRRLLRKKRLRSSTDSRLLTFSGAFENGKTTNKIGAYIRGKEREVSPFERRLFTLLQRVRFLVHVTWLQWIYRVKAITKVYRQRGRRKNKLPIRRCKRQPFQFVYGFCRCFMLTGV